MDCFICKNKFKTINELAHHLKEEEGLKTNSSFRCFDDSCRQVFNHFPSYKRHILRLHFNKNIKEQQIENYNHSVLAHHLIEESRPQHQMNEDYSKSRNTNINNLEYQLNINNYLQVLLDNAMKFTLTLHSNNNFTRKDVFQVQDNLVMLIIKPVLEVFRIFAKENFESNSTTYSQFINILNNCANPFRNCDTDYNLFQALKRSGHIGDVNDFIISNDLDSKFCRGELTYGEYNVKASFLPLRLQFRLLFEQNEVFEEMLQNMNYLKQSNEYFTNFIQGPIWKEKCKLYPGKLLVPYFLYADDLEINNPLGAHSMSHSICNFYYSFTCLQYHKSKLDNIYLACVIKSQDLKKYGNQKCLEPLIAELIFLEEEGISLNLKDGTYHHVHFVLGLFLGDNLGLNSILDFNKSFSSTSFCRFCKVNKADAAVLCVEKSELMRTRDNYHDDIILQNSQQTGVSNVSCFNQIKSFHVVDNFAVDVMHDIFEGICHYDLSHILLYCIQDMNYFTLDTLNIRKQNFEYGPIEIGNLSKEIKIYHLNKHHFKMSAREMLTFVMYLPLMIGDLVSADDDVWKFLINLIDIIDLILSYKITDYLIESLQQKIEFHNAQYLKLFKDTLKPKFHNLTHYPTILRKSGPVRMFWSFKFEAKHKQFKIYAHTITSRRNICLTIAKKYQLKFADQIINFKNHPIFEAQIKDKIDSIFYNIIKNKLKVPDGHDIEMFNKIQYNGIIYKKGYYVAKCVNDYTIYNIILIVKFNSTVVLFCQQLRDILYRQHYTAFEIDPNNLGELAIVKFEDVIGPPLTVIKTIRGQSKMATQETGFSIISPLQPVCDKLNNSYTFVYEPIPLMAKNTDEPAALQRTEIKSNHNDLFQLLKNWNQEHLYNALINEDIDLSTLKIIKPHNIKCLFAKLNFKIGETVRFENNLEMWRLSIGLPYYSVHSQLNTNESTNNSNTNLVTKCLDSQNVNESKLSEVIKSTTSLDVTNYSNSNNSVRDFCCITLEEILVKKSNGQAILDYYSKHKKINSIHRTTLINVIAQYFNENDLHLSLEASYHFEREICKRFDCEKPEYYRIGRRGKLYTKFCNLKSNTRKLKPKQVPAVSRTYTKLELQPEDDAEQCIKSLKYDNLSVEDFDLLWQACGKYRLLQIRTSNQSMKTVFGKWPQYKLPSGSRLIDSDFKILHPEKEDIFDHWPENFKNILKFLKEDNRIKSSEILNVLITIKEEDYEKDEAIVKLLWCVHGFLVPTQKILRKDNNGKKSIVKYTIRDSQETFIYVGSNLQQIDDYIRFVQGRGENIQPFILAIGHQELSHFQQFYIYVDEVKLSFNNILRAVDICFKMFYIFNLQYPAAGEHFWIFIEKYFYKINNNVKNKSTKVCFMIDELNKN